MQNLKNVLQVERKKQRKIKSRNKKRYIRKKSENCKKTDDKAIWKAKEKNDIS